MTAQSWVGDGNGGDSTIHNPNGISGPIYSPLGGPSPVKFTQETAAAGQVTCSGGATLKNMQVLISQITGTAGNAAMTAGVSINGATGVGNQTVSISSYGGGITSIGFLMSDATHSDAIADQSTYGVIFTGLSGSASTVAGIVTPGVSFEQDAPTNYCMLTAFTASYTGINSAVKYVTLIGTINGTSTEAQTQMTLPVSVTLDKLQAFLSGLGSGAVTVHSRINATSGNQSAHLIAASTLVIDATHTDALAQGAFANYQVDAGGASPTFGMISMRASPAAGQSILASAFVNGANGSSSSTTYWPFLGQVRADPTSQRSETLAATPFSGTLSLLNVYINNNGATAYTYQLLKGNSGATTANQSLPLAASFTGIQYDNTHTDAVVGGVDMITLSLPSGASAVSNQAQSILFTAPGGVVVKPDNMLLMGVG